VSDALRALRAEPLRRFKPYPAYKESGVEWLGDIPAHWEVKRLKRVFRVVNGSTPASGEPAFWDGDIPWATPEDLGDLRGKTIEATRRNLTKAGYRSCGTTLVPAGSLVLSTRAPIGHLALAGVELCTNQGCRSLVFRSAVSRDFFFYELLAARPELESLGQGSTFRELAKGMLEDVELADPPEPEQRAIAAFLDRETARIDALVAKKEQLIELLQEKRTALITRAVTKGLDPTVPMKDSGVEWLGEIPAHWDARQGRYLYRALNLLPQEDDGVVTAYRDGQVTLREKRRAEGYTFAIQEVGYQRVRAGDLVIQGMDAFAGAIGVADSTGKCSPEYLVLEPIVPDTDNRYFAAALRLMAKRGYITVVCNAVRERAPRFRVPEFRSVMLPEPPTPEQRAIAAFLERGTARIDALIAKVRDAIDRLKELRTALISAAVTGKIDVREDAA